MTITPTPIFLSVSFPWRRDVVIRLSLSAGAGCKDNGRRPARDCPGSRQELVPALFDPSPGPHEDGRHRGGEPGLPHAPHHAVEAPDDGRRVAVLLEEPL